MKTKSFIASILLCSSLLGVLGFSTLATNTVSASEVPKIEIATEELDLNSDQVIISENMTRDEVIQSISNEFGISKEQAEQSISSNSSQMRRQVADENFVLLRAAWQDRQINNSVEGGLHILL